MTRKREFNFAKLYNAKKLIIVYREAKHINDASKDCIVLNEAVEVGLVWLDRIS
jgi:hypothetical protein